MSKKIAKFDQVGIAVGLLLLLSSSTCFADVYKWVDANGQTHFSERGGVAGRKPIELKGWTPSTAPQTSNSATQSWQDQERQFRERQEAKQILEQPRGPQVVKAPKSLSGGTAKWEDSDAWRCNLARDILSGAVKRRGGSQITRQDEISAAEQDIRTYCH